MLFKSAHRPEIISLHIPKTAGTSFRNLLKNVYGEKEVVRFDIDTNNIVRLNEKVYESTKLPDATVIHGHFVFQTLQVKFPLPKDYKLITWVRDPVKRVVSNFYYLESRIKELLDEEKNNLNILSKLQRTLIEFARAEINRNRQSKFLTGSTLSDYTFVGVQEFYEEDISRLARILNWKELPSVPFHNRTVEKPVMIPEEILDEIRELNREDQLIYEEALELRKQDPEIMKGKH